MGTHGKHMKKVGDCQMLIQAHHKKNGGLFKSLLPFLHQSKLMEEVEAVWLLSRAAVLKRHPYADMIDIKRGRN